MADHTSPYTALELLHQGQADDTPLARERQKAAYRLLFAHQIEQPGVHTLVRELRSTVDEYNERVLIGETEDLSYYGRGDDELHLVLNFPLMDPPRLPPPPGCAPTSRHGWLGCRRAPGRVIPSATTIRRASTASLATAGTTPSELGWC